MPLLPARFVRIQSELLGEKAPEWLSRLPDIVATCARQWDLTLGSMMEPLTYNYIVRARRIDGTPVVLKICSPGGEFETQAEALRLFNGQGAVRLFETDPHAEVMLLEDCEPGTMLSTIEDDELATSIAASVMQQLWRPAPPTHPFPTVQDWGQGFRRMRIHFDGGSGPFPAALVDQAEHLFQELERSMADPVVLHGDLHHDNILAAQRAPWLVIDPKGLVGEPAYETGALLRNRLPDPPTDAATRRLLARRIAQLSEELDIDRTRIWAWALSQAVLSAWWTVEDHGQDWADAISIAEQLAALAI